MSGRPNKKLWQTMVEKHGSEAKAREWYASVGRLGGLAKVPKGFGVNRELASTAGRKGGRKSVRGKAKTLDNYPTPYEQIKGGK